VHHRRCISLQDGRDQLQRNVETQRVVHVGGGAEVGKEGSGITAALLGKDATKEEMEGYVVRLESEIRQLEAKLDDFKCHSLGWVGLEEKRNRKKLVDEMSRTLASKRKQLHACHKRLRAVDKQLQATLSAGSSKSPSSDDDDGEDGGSPPNTIKELLDAASSKPYGYTQQA
jgi:exonuclease VII small subunit